MKIITILPNDMRVVHNDFFDFFNVSLAARTYMYINCHWGSAGSITSKTFSILFSS